MVSAWPSGGGFATNDDRAALSVMMNRPRPASLAEVEATVEALVTHCVTPRALGDLYPWAERHRLRPQELRQIMRALIRHGRLATDLDPEALPDWSLISAAAPGAAPPPTSTPEPPVFKDLDPTIDPTAPDVPADAYGTVKLRVLEALVARPDGVQAYELAKTLGIHQGSVRSVLVRAASTGEAIRAGLLFFPTAGSAAAEIRGRRPPPGVIQATHQTAERHRASVLAALATGPLRSGELGKAAGVNNSSLFRALRVLRERGEVTQTPLGTYALTGVVEAVAPIVAPAPPAADRLAAARAAVAALSPDELDTLMASLAPVVEARRALAAALAGLRGAA